LRIFVKNILLSKTFLYEKTGFSGIQIYGISYFLLGARLEEMDSNGYQRGLCEFNKEAFFEAHEALEDTWRIAPVEERKFLQALVQLAVAFHHFKKGNLAGAGSVMKRAGQNLAAYPNRFGGLDLTSLRLSIAQWQHALRDGTPVPPLPKL
jgi:predicted metal-dependent hydrolase